MKCNIKNFKKGVITLLTSGGLLVCSEAHAVAAWSTNLTINSIVPTDTNISLVVTGNDNPIGCSVSNWVRMNSTDANFALVSATLLAAFYQGKQVKLWEYGCNTDGTIKFISAWIDR